MNKDYIKAGRSKQKQKTRDRILAGAKDLLNRTNHFSLDDVAEVTSLSRATIYRYFSSAEALSLEAALDLGTKSPEEVLHSIDGKNDVEQTVLGIQDYFNQLALNNESVFRKYLSTVITQPPEGRKRGARRHHTLEKALKELNPEISPSDRKKFIVVATALMGVEPIIVAKDVSGLTDKRTKEVLSWGMQTLLKGLLHQHK